MAKDSRLTQYLTVLMVTEKYLQSQKMKRNRLYIYIYIYMTRHFIQ